MGFATDYFKLATCKLTAPHKPLSEYNQAALSTGAKVEMEHTANKVVAKNIAANHLDEMPNYYKMLKRMEESRNA